MARGSKPGEKRGGRKKGTPNKKSKKAEEQILELCNPFEEMVRLARLAEDNQEYNTAIGAYKELAQYIAPKRKAVEVTGENGNPIIMQAIGIKGVDAQHRDTK